MGLEKLRLMIRHGYKMKLKKTRGPMNSGFQWSPSLLFKQLEMGCGVVCHNRLEALRWSARVHECVIHTIVYKLHG